MTDLTAARKATTRLITNYDLENEFPLATSAVAYAGAGAAYDASGNLTRASAAGAVKTAGVFVHTNASAASGDTMKIEEGIFKLNNGSNALTNANRGQPCYWEDDNTVGSLASTGIFAGFVYDVQSDGVLVIIKPTFFWPSSPIAGTLPHAIKTTNYTVANVTDGNALLQSATDAVQFTLPKSAAANKGQRVTLQNTGAATAVEIQVLLADSGDKILGTVMAVSAGGVAGHGMKNTKATSKQGDYLTLASDGAGVWWIVTGMGVWASL